MDKSSLEKLLALPLLRASEGRLGALCVAAMVSPVAYRVMQEAQKKETEVKRKEACRGQ